MREKFSPRCRKKTAEFQKPYCRGVSSFEMKTLQLKGLTKTLDSEE